MKLFFINKTLFLTLMISFSININAQIYVNESAFGANDGSSWTDAYQSLQDAIAAASSGDDIWVATGTYYPSDYPAGCSGCSTSRDYTFQLKDGVSLYGGFMGNESTLNQRNIEANPTVLSGDIGTLSDNSDNVYHVVLGSFTDLTATTRIDGFTITAGNADGISTTITVNSNTIVHHYGGGIYTHGGTININNNTIEQNIARNFGGVGGGVYVTDSKSFISQNIISENEGGALGGIALESSTNVIFNNIISGNEATTGNGGGIGMLWCINTLYNNQISGNITDNKSGGGIFSVSSDNDFANNTISGNLALSGFGGGIFFNGGTNTLSNDIVYGNSSSIFNQISTLTIDRSIVEDGCPMGATCSNLLTSNPNFVMSVPSAPSTGGDLRLQFGSPAINTANNSAYQSVSGIDPANDTDLAGFIRLDGGQIDRGVYEFTSCPGGNVLYVNTFAFGNNDGSSWTNAFTDLQSALDLDCPNITEIWVATGTYIPSAYPRNCNPLDCTSPRYYTFHLRDGISLYGGFAGFESSINQRDLEANLTILSGDVGTPSDRTDNTYHVLTAVFPDTSSTSRIDGFTISDGYADGVNFPIDGTVIISDEGAGIYFHNGTITISNNTITGNFASAVGGAGKFIQSHSTLYNNIISGNEAPATGGLDFIGGVSDIFNCTFAGNLSDSFFQAEASFSLNGLFTITNSIFWRFDNSTLIGVFGTTNLNITNSIIKNVCPNNSTCTDVIFDDPLFVSQPPAALGVTGDLRLRDCSPGINSGDNSEFTTGTTIDIINNTRIYDGTIDMGAYENQNSTNWTGSNSNDFSSVLNWESNLPDDNNFAIIEDITQNTPNIAAMQTSETRSLCIRPQGELDVEGILKVNDVLHNDGVLRFNSDAISTGQLDEFNGNEFGTGEYRVERFVPADNRSFRYISSPVNTFGSINENLQEGVTTASPDPNPNPGFGTHITGGANVDGFDTTETNNPSMFEWDVNNQEWDAVSNTTPKSLQIGEAYALMIRGDRSTTLDSNTAVGPETTLRFNGNIHTGDYVVPTGNLSSTIHDYNFIANPYQSIVNLKSLLESSDANDLDDQTIYIYDPTLGTRGGYAAVDISMVNPEPTPSTSDADENLMPNQAFFVETIGNNPELTFKENFKNPNSDFVDTFSDNLGLSQINLNLKRQPDDIVVDGVTVKFDTSFSDIVDNADAQEFWNYDERVALHNSNHYLSIEKRNLPEVGDEIQIYTANYRADDYVWQIDMSNISQDVVLYDSYLDTENLLNLDMSTTIAFSVDHNIPESEDPFRFSIRFKEVSLSNNDQNLSDVVIYPNPVTKNNLHIKGLDSLSDVKIQIYDISGQLIISKNETVKNIVNVNINESFTSGIYQLKLIQNESVLNTKFIIKH